MSYITALADARKAETLAAHALTTALKHVQPPTPEVHELFVNRDPSAYAKALRKMADILETIPALRTAAQSALDALSELEKQACHRCNGTGRYSGPTNATRRGVPYCFYCDGHGTKRK